MKEYSCQMREGYNLVPYTAEDLEIASSFKINQPLVVKVTVYGPEKQRSLPQLHLFWACCAEVVINKPDINFSTRDKVGDQVKVALNFVDLNKSFVDPNGIFHPHYRSISVKNLKHMAACNFFDQAFPVLAGWIKVTVDELIEMAQSKMKRQG